MPRSRQEGCGRYSRGMPLALAREQRWIVGLWAALALGCGWLGARLWADLANTLAVNGRWVATKNEVAKELMGAESFYRGRQTLAGGLLNLGAWHGYQEVVSARPLAAERLEVDLLLQSGAHLAVSFGRLPGGGYSGIRLSQVGGRPSAFFTATAEGEFVRLEPIPAPGSNSKGGSSSGPGSSAGTGTGTGPGSRAAGGTGSGLGAGAGGTDGVAADGNPAGGPAVTPKPLRLARDRMTRLVVEFGTDRVGASLDGAPLGEYAVELPAAHHLGLRGGFKNAYVDRLEVRLRGGGSLVETFDAPPAARRVTLLAMVGALLLNALGYVLISRWRGGDATELALYFVMVNGTLLVLALLFWGFERRRADRYPAETAALTRTEEDWLEGAVAGVRAAVGERYAKVPEAGVVRIVVLGSSQTWGAGAGREDETPVAALERRMNAEPAGPRVECINLGIPATVAAHHARLLQRRWWRLRPHLAVVNLSNNDRDTGRFAVAMERLLAAAERRGVPVVLVQEPNSPERQDRTLAANHRTLAALGEKWGAPVVPMHADLAALSDTGFLWWDKVHMTSLGYRLFAERLHQTLAPLVAPLD